MVCRHHSLGLEGVEDGVDIGHDGRVSDELGQGSITCALGFELEPRLHHEVLCLLGLGKAELLACLLHQEEADVVALAGCGIRHLEPGGRVNPHARLLLLLLENGSEELGGYAAVMRAASCLGGAHLCRKLRSTLQHEHLVIHDLLMDHG